MHGTYMVLLLLPTLVYLVKNNRNDGTSFLYKNDETERFEYLYRRWGSKCLGKNIVMDRGDGYGVALPRTRPWSVSAKSYQDGNQKMCGSLDSLLRAVRNGHRVWEEGEDKTVPAAIVAEEERPVNTSLLYETQPSHFLPRGCHLPYIGKEQACKILSRYSHVVIAGDSLARHTAQGLNMLLKEDWMLGAYPLGSGLAPDLMDKCRCDGQFSEHKLCRSFDGQKLLPGDPRDCGACTWLSSQETFHLHYLELPGKEDGPVWEQLCNEDPRPGLIMLNGGTHFGSGVETTKKDLITKTYEKLQEVKTRCQWTCDIKMVWAGLNAQSRLLDQRYPHQSRESAKHFNDLMDDYVASRLGMLPLSFWNLTRDAPTSDGFHYLSDVNMYKAIVLLHVARLI